MRFNSFSFSFVPNAPCGVERGVYFLTQKAQSGVPNAPCGVESLDFAWVVLACWEVPNAPCGVESAAPDVGSNSFPMFLMHRVELKDKEWKKWKKGGLCS